MPVLNAKRYTLYAGFTLMEALITIAIIGIVTAASVSSLSGFNAEQALRAETERIVSLLGKARAQTLAAKDGAAYGVHFEERKAVLFRGSAYSALHAANQPQALNSSVKIASISLAGGGAEVVFQKLTGDTEQSGTVRLSRISDAAASSTVTIAATGVAYSD